MGTVGMECLSLGDGEAAPLVSSSGCFAPDQPCDLFRQKDKAFVLRVSGEVSFD
uniref:Uncharacterized protein n=1 Tax=Neovison vison TaxID=452646 RepID=A0A8C7BXZ1_NEOVI